VSLEKIDVLGVGVSATTYGEVVSRCEEWIRERPMGTALAGHYICVTSVHGVMEARNDFGLRTILNDADIVTPDGMPLVWALRSFGVEDQQRVYGPDLMLHLCTKAEASGHRVFLYGGRPDTLDNLRKKLQERFSKLVIAGQYSPPFRSVTTEEDQEICRLISAAQPDVIFVGISTPKQEVWMASHRWAFPGVVMIGVGAAFDFHAGHVRQAPEWMRAKGLEWLFRLLQEPRRLWKRYVVTTPWFLPCWGLQKLSLITRNAACGDGKKRHR
jgi:N-acetylglucosaminyldiphosphoundecaprenol N-acetyl-beta-D-mannosaminyltransferase